MQISTPGKIENWNDLKVFLAVARGGSLLAAAKALQLNHSTVYRRIAALEEAADARLFERLARGYRLTEVGEAMLALVVRIEEDVHAIGRQVLGADTVMRGTVRLTTVDELGIVIAPALRAFHERYPQVVLDMSAEQRVFSLTRREADVALRPGPKPTEPDVMGRKLCGLATAGYASREYLLERGWPKRTLAAEDYDYIFLEDALSHLPAQRWLRAFVKEPRVVMRTNNMVGQLTACKAGLGVASLPCFMADGEPSLVRVFEPRSWKTYGLWLLMHTDLRQTARVRCFVDFLSDAIAELAPVFEGTKTAKVE